MNEKERGRERKGRGRSRGCLRELQASQCLALTSWSQQLIVMYALIVGTQTVFRYLKEGNTTDLKDRKKEVQSLAIVGTTSFPEAHWPP